MAITEDDIYICDYCGEDTGKFNQDTGNHPSCEELSALRERMSLMEKELASILLDMFLDGSRVDSNKADKIAAKFWGTWEEVIEVTKKASK